MPKAQIIRKVLPSSLDPLTGRFRIMPTTPTPTAKNLKYTGPSGSTGPSEVNRRLSIKVEEEDKETEEEGEEHEEEGEFILYEGKDQMDYKNEIPDTQHEWAILMKTWEIANLLSIAQLGDIHLKTRKPTPKQPDEVTDLLVAIDKVINLNLYI